MRVRRATLAKLLAAVFVVNLVVMSAGAALSYQQAPPIPEEVVGPDGEVVVSEADVRDGKETFQRNGLMNHGSVLGNGAYFGPDYTAEPLELKVRHMRDYYATQRHGTDFVALDDGDRAAIAADVRTELETSRVEDGRIHYSEAELYAHQEVRETYVDRYHDGAPERGVPAGMIGSERAATQFADFALWTAWVAHAPRPDDEAADGVAVDGEAADGETSGAETGGAETGGAETGGAETGAGESSDTATAASYTNNWPPNAGAGNEPGGSVLTWSVISVALLVLAGGAAIWLYSSVDLEEPEGTLDRVPDPDERDVLPSQRAAAGFLGVAAVLFTIQVGLGTLLAHYYVERDAVFGVESVGGVEILQALPFALARTWHIDLGILWIATAWLGIGLFLPGLLTGHEPDRQGTYVRWLLGALVVVVAGGLAGVWLGAQGYLDAGILGVLEDDAWWLFGNEGLEYLEVGRVWQAGLFVGFVGWAWLVARGLRPLLERESRYGLAHLICYAGASIALLFLAGFLYTPRTNIVISEFWRWWVIHMWVEGAFEFFIVALVAVTLVSMNLLARASAAKAVLFEALFVMGAAIIGVSHHYWWIGQPDVWIPVGTVFSTLELIPLVYILIESLKRYRALVAETGGFPYRLPFAFVVASGIWNFVGAGAMGFFINLPIVNYYEHGTYLTPAHAHAAMFGAFGLLAIGLGIYALRILVVEREWSERRLWWAFGLWNLGLVVMVFGSLTPLGLLQLEVSFTEGYAAARSVAFYETATAQRLLWMRVPGDTIFAAGTLLFLFDVGSKLRNLRSATPAEERTEPAVAQEFGAEEGSEAEA